MQLIARIKPATTKAG